MQDGRLAKVPEYFGNLVTSLRCVFSLYFVIGSDTFSTNIHFGKPNIYIYIQILLWAILFTILRINYDVHLSGPRPRFTLQWSSNLNIVFNMACCQWLLIIGGNDQYDRKENYAIIECINYCTPCIYICKVCHNWYGQYDLYAKYAMMNTHDQYDRYAKYAKYAVVQNENEWESSGSLPAK